MHKSDRGHFTRGGNGQFTRNVQTAQQDAECARLRSAGLTYRAIADDLGLCDASAARKCVERALLATVAEPAEELRRLELMKLDQLSVAAWEILEDNHVRVSAGRVMFLDDEPLPDTRPVLQAVDRLLKIAERRARLCGLDAPIQVSGITMDAVDAEIVRLDAEIAAQHAAREL